MTADTKTRHPTEAQLAVMLNLEAGRPPAANLQGRHAMGGLAGTLSALHRRGWTDSPLAPRLTDAGHEALDRATQPKEKSNAG